MATKPRRKMPVSERAKQFMPFEAVKGLRDALKKKEKIIVPKVVLSEEMAIELNQKLQLIHKGMVVTVTYFNNDEYIRITGMVALLDETNRILQIVDTKISFDDVLDIALM